MALVGRESEGTANEGHERDDNLPVAQVPSIRIGRSFRALAGTSGIRGAASRVLAAKNPVSGPPFLPDWRTELVALRSVGLYRRMVSPFSFR